MSKELHGTASLEALQGTEQRKIMDLVGPLRRASLSSILKLPQLVVYGDQSSGKSDPRGRRIGRHVNMFGEEVVGTDMY